ncbi:GtrA family protein [Thalassotalea euphylliae]|uniref:GtrA family protein n=1 Tax=Thalassotalea euphylliae TaxID=1655234 RepID=A0A3E0TR14_9GAMM|nr:GtrA family protein [Thalassotalea euphylliae]REL26954.1 GtrA family protein [Thalassotalea euphylliae]
MTREFYKFLSVGTIGFIADSLCFTALQLMGNDLLLSRLIAFWLAVNVTWLGNKYFTFVDNDGHSHSGQLAKISRDKTASMQQQWLHYVFYCHLSGLLNISVFFAASLILPLSVSFVLGILVGTVSNFWLSKFVVFAKASV